MRRREQWTEVHLPALADEGDLLGRRPGEALWPDKYDREWLLDQRAAMGTPAFEALYKGNPVPAGGFIFKRERFRYFTREHDYYLLRQPDGEVRRIYKGRCWIGQTCDTAYREKQTNDFTVCTTFAVTPERDILVLRVARVRIPSPEQWGWITTEIAWGKARDNYRWTGVEDANSGAMLLDLADKRGVALRALKAVSDKGTRAADAATFYENGKVWHLWDAEWLADYERELLMFPKGEHDDQVDTIAYAVREVPTEPIVQMEDERPRRQKKDPLQDYGPRGSGLDDW